MAFFITLLSFLSFVIIVHDIAVKWMLFYILPVSSVEQVKADRHAVFKRYSTQMRVLFDDFCTNTLRKGNKNTWFCNHVGRCAVMTDAVSNLYSLFHFMGIVHVVDQHVIACEIREADGCVFLC